MKQARRVFRPRAAPAGGHVLQDDHDAVYAVQLTREPSFEWRAAFLRPPPRLTNKRRAADIGRVEVRGATVTFRTTPARLTTCVRRIDRWIAYANSVVEE